MSMEVFVQALVDEGVSAFALPRLLKLAREAHEKPVSAEALRKRKERALKRGNEWDQSTQSEIVRDLSVTCHATSPMVFKNDLKNFPSPSKNNTTAPASPSLPAAPSKFLAEEFTPTTENVAIAEKHGIEAGEFDAQLDRFRGYYADHEPKTLRYWEGKFKQWLVSGLDKHCDRRWAKPTKTVGKPTSQKPKAPVGASSSIQLNKGDAMAEAIDALKDLPADAAEPRIRVMRRIQNHFGEAIFVSWFARLQIRAIEANHAVVTVPTAFYKTYIESNFKERLVACIRAEFPSVQSVEILVRATASDSADAKPSLSRGTNQVHSTVKGNDVNVLRLVEDVGKSLRSGLPKYSGNEPIRP